MRKSAYILIFSASLINVGAVAQNPPKLILETAPQSTEIALKDSVSISSDGTITATPVDADACQVTGSCEGVSVSVTSFDSLSAQNGTITLSEGSNFELNWRSTGATSCQPEGNFQPWLSKGSLVTDSRDATNAQRTLSTNGSAAASPYELKLKCSNGTVSSTIDSSSVLNLVVNEVVPPSPTSCEGREPISGWTRLTRCVLGSNADCRTWSPGIWSNSFLGSIGITQKIQTNVSGARQYVAIRFDTNGMSPSASGRLQFERGEGVWASGRLTISKCPGDFNSDQVTGCFITGRPSAALWRGPNSSASTSCILEPNSVYYLNILATESDATVSPNAIEPHPRCGDQVCGWSITPR